MEQVDTQTEAVIIDPDGRLTDVLSALETGGFERVVRVEDIDDAPGTGDVALVLDAPARGENPDVDGIELQAVAEQRLSVPVAVYTFREGSAPITRALKHGAADVIRMPARHANTIAARLRRAAGTGGEFQTAAAQIRSLLSNYPHPLYIKDGLGRFANVTTFTASNYGLTREQLIGLTDYELFSEDHAAKLYAEEQDIIATESPVVRKVEEYVDETGARRWVMTTKVPRYDQDGDIVGIVGGTRDVTAAKRQEEMMAGLHEASRELSRAQTRDEIANVSVDIASDISLFTGVEVILEETAHRTQAVRESSAEERPIGSRQDAIDRAVATGRTQYVDTDGIVTDDQSTVVESTFAGRPFDEEVGIVVSLGEHGVICLSVDDGLFDDFTNRLAHVLAANVEVALDRAQRERQLSRKNRQLEEFATIGAHELRNRLQIVLASVVRERAERESERLAGAEATLERMDRLLTQLLRLARTGEIPRTRESIDLRRTVERAWGGIDDTGTVSLDPPPSTVIRANPDALIELFEFLFRNAVEHAGEDVQVAVGLLTDGEGFYVQDDGIGIPEQLQAELFEVAYSDAADETGYGLYIAAAIVEAHGWEITVGDSTAGGARFEVTGVDRP